MPAYQKVFEKHCGDCAHFRKHYIKQGCCYRPLIYGHCVFPRLKPRKETDQCPHWIARTP